MKPNTERLRKLFTADPVLDKFNFNIVREVKSCGTIGCKMGELPVVFPEHWKARKELWGWGSNWPVLRFRGALRKEDINSQVMRYFSLTPTQFSHLFTPDGQRYGRRKLSTGARRSTVNANGIDFCDRIDAGEDLP
jgi:hypothetical protein